MTTTFSKHLGIQRLGQRLYELAQQPEGITARAAGRLFGAKVRAAETLQMMERTRRLSVERVPNRAKVYRADPTVTWAANEAQLAVDRRDRLRTNTTDTARRVAAVRAPAMDGRTVVDHVRLDGRRVKRTRYVRPEHPRDPLAPREFADLGPGRYIPHDSWAARSVGCAGVRA